MELGKRPLLGLTNAILSLTSVPAQDVFISWAHSYANFHNSTNCWICGAMSLSVMDRLPWWVSPLRSSLSPTITFLCSPGVRRSHQWARDIGLHLTGNEKGSLTKGGQVSRYLEQYYQVWDEYFWVTPEKGQFIAPATIFWEQKEQKVGFGDCPLDPKGLVFVP